MDVLPLALPPIPPERDVARGTSARLLGRLAVVRPFRRRTPVPSVPIGRLVTPVNTGVTRVRALPSGVLDMVLRHTDAPASAPRRRPVPLALGNVTRLVGATTRRP